MDKDIFRRKSNMNMNITAEMYNEALIIIADLCLKIVNNVLNQLGMPSINLSAAASFYVELCRELNYKTVDLLSFEHVKLNIPKLTFDQKGIYDQMSITGLEKYFS